jgi:ABC-2 type transport system permease protein
MRKFYTLLSREVRSYFHSPIAYVVLIFFLLISGVDFYFQVSFMNQRQVQYWQVVLAKFLGALVFYIVLWIPTLLYFAIFLKLTNQPAAHSAGAYFGSYLMLLLLGMFYLSIGCLTSVLTRNQIIAAIVSFCAITLLFFLGLVQFILLDVSSATRDLLGYFSAIDHMVTFSRGVIDTRPIVFYLSMTIVMLTLTYQAFQSRKWRL